MSAVSDFSQAMGAQAFGLIGAEPLIIGGTTLQCVLAEAMDQKDFADGGYELGADLTAVCRSDELPPELLVKRLATARGKQYRVASVSIGATFATISLEIPTKA